MQVGDKVLINGTQKELVILNLLPDNAHVLCMNPLDGANGIMALKDLILAHKALPSGSPNVAYQSPYSVGDRVLYTKTNELGYVTGIKFLHPLPEIEVKWDFLSHILFYPANSKYLSLVNAISPQAVAASLRGAAGALNIPFPPGYSVQGNYGSPVILDTHIMDTEIEYKDVVSQCECGAHKVGSNQHSDWCKLNSKVNAKRAPECNCSHTATNRGHDRWCLTQC